MIIFLRSKLASKHRDTIISFSLTGFISHAIFLVISLFRSLSLSLGFSAVGYSLNDHISWHESAFVINLRDSCRCNVPPVLSAVSSGGLLLPSSGQAKPRVSRVRETCDGGRGWHFYPQVFLRRRMRPMLSQVEGRLSCKICLPLSSDGIRVWIGTFPQEHEHGSGCFLLLFIDRNEKVSNKMISLPAPFLWTSHSMKAPKPTKWV